MFLFAKKGRPWLWITVVLAALALATYYGPAAAEGFRHGGSLWGLIYGTATVVLFVKLLLFGVRKRAYSSTLGNLETWLHAHVYLGLLTLLLAGLHTGGRFEDKLAVTTFVVMALVVVSGLFGVAVYTVMPRLLTDTGEALDAEETTEALNRLGKRMAAVASGRSPAFVNLYRRLIRRSNPRLLEGWRLLLSRPGRSKQVVEADLRRFLGEVAPEEAEPLEKLLSLSKQRQELSLSFGLQKYYRNWLDVWLFIHLPLSIALIVLVVAHVVSALYFSGALESLGLGG